jgi:hypothetical protein
MGLMKFFPIFNSSTNKMSLLFIDLLDIPRMTEAKLKNLLQALSTPEAILIHQLKNS